MRLRSEDSQEPVAPKVQRCSGSEWQASRHFMIFRGGMPNFKGSPGCHCPYSRLFYLEKGAAVCLRVSYCRPAFQTTSSNLFSSSSKKKKKKRTCNWMKLATLTTHKTVPQSLKSEEKNTQLLLSLMDLINHKGVNKSWRSRRMSAAA